MKRWIAQRWILDNIIRTLGPEWDQGRVGYTTAAVGVDMAMEAMSIRMRVKKFNDITREFQRVAKARESKAKQAESEGHLVTARESYLAASLMYGAAEWPIFEDDNPELLELNEKKNACYDKYIQYAPHHVERVEIPFEGNSLSGLLHLPPNTDGKRMPFLLAFGGMDDFKEITVRMYGDKYLERGIGVLAVDGPGQGESAVRKIKVSLDNFERAGKVSMDYLLSRKEVDRERVCICGVSMGSYWVPRVLAYDDRFLAAAVALVCHEPGLNTIFNAASPSFKLRFMWMAGILDEDEFDRYAGKMSLKGIGAKVKCPLLIVAGEDDDLSPIQYTHDFYQEVKAPKKLILYEGERHSVPGPCWADEVADWIRDRIDGKPLEPARIVRSTCMS